jgi:hypothetical protein
MMNRIGSSHPSPFKVLIEALSQKACIASDDVVVASVVIGHAVKDLRADTLLFDLMGISRELLLADVEQKLLKQVRFAEAFARGDPKRQLPFLSR